MPPDLAAAGRPSPLPSGGASTSSRPPYRLTFADNRRIIQNVHAFLRRGYPKLQPGKLLQPNPDSQILGVPTGANLVPTSFGDRLAPLTRYCDWGYPVVPTGANLNRGIYLANTFCSA